MAYFGLPRSVFVGGVEYKINSDYRAVLDIFAALNDVDLSDEERGAIVLMIFYPEYETIPQQYYNEAIEACFDFINLGKPNKAKSATKEIPVVDWEKDFTHMIAPINHIAGTEVRELEYLHWWTFMSYYNEISGDCYFAQIVQIRTKLNRGKKLEKEDREFYQRNREDIEIHVKMTEAEQKLMDEWVS